MLGHETFLSDDHANALGRGRYPVVPGLELSRRWWLILMANCSFLEDRVRRHSKTCFRSVLICGRGLTVMVALPT
jgi:hypothetical protein